MKLSFGGSITFDILSHELVPDFKILTKEEKAKVLEKYGVDETKMPKISDSDPVINVIGAKVGDLLEITRKSKTAGTSLYYRIVTGKKPVVEEPAEVDEAVDEETEDDSDEEDFDSEGSDED